MNKLIFDYTARNKMSRLQRRLMLIFGILLLGGSLFLLINQILNPLGTTFLIIAVAHLLMGIAFIMQSTDHRLVYPRKFLKISPRGLQFKLGALHKEVSLDWDQVTKIRSSRRSLSFVLENDQLITLNMIHFPSSDEKKIRAMIDLTSKSKNIILI